MGRTEAERMEAGGIGMPKRKLFLGSLSLLLAALCAIQLAHRGADAPAPSAPVPARQASLGLSQARQPITLELMAS